MDMVLTKVQRRDLRTISRDPGCYSKCKEDGELMTLVNMGLIRWLEIGGYEITDAGRSALKQHEEKTMGDLILKATAEGQYKEGLKHALKIIEARLPLYTDIGQINALRECISSIMSAMEDQR